LHILSSACYSLLVVVPDFNQWSSLDEWSGRRRDLYLTTHKTQKTDIYSPDRIRTRNASNWVAANPRLL